MVSALLLSWANAGAANSVAVAAKRQSRLMVSRFMDSSLCAAPNANARWPLAVWPKCSVLARFFGPFRPWCFWRGLPPKRPRRQISKKHRKSGPQKPSATISRAAGHCGRRLRQDCRVETDAVRNIAARREQMKLMVGVIGFEPATPSSRTRCSTRLSHTPTDGAAYTFGPAALQAPSAVPAPVLTMQAGAAMTGPQVTRVAKADRAAIAEAVRLLAAGALFAFPTETVYGVGADATNGQAVARIYEAKGRPTFNPLIAHVIDLEAARALGRFSADAARLAEAFWPGPLTLVLPRTAACPVADLATAGLDSIAVRVPNHIVARAILETFGKPVVAPSANRSGHVSPTIAAHVLADLGGRIELIVDGGSTPVGVESTVIACLDDPVMLRPGGVAREAVERALAKPLARPEPNVT